MDEPILDPQAALPVGLGEQLKRIATFESLLTTGLGKYYAIARKITHDHDDALDAVHNAGTRIYAQVKAGHPYAHGDAAALGFAVKNEAIDMLRRRKVHGTRVNGTNEPAHDESIVRFFIERLTEVREQLEKLQIEKRGTKAEMAIALLIEQIDKDEPEWTITKLAKANNMNPNSFGSVISRIRHRMRGMDHD